MNRFLFAATLALASSSFCSFAQADENAAVNTLKGECAAKYDAKLDAKPAQSNEYEFVYAKGEYKGEDKAGKALHCTQQQYVAFLETVEPDRAMAAYPTAAGKPAVKDAKDASKK